MADTGDKEIKRLFTQIDIIRGLVDQEVGSSVRETRFRRFGERSYPEFKDPNLIKRSFNRLKKDWFACMEDRIPKGGPGRKRIDDIFEKMSNAAEGSIPFRHRGRAQRAYRGLYLTCFEKLEEETSNLTRSCLIKTFWRTQRKEIQKFQERYGQTENVFVSINYGGSRPDDDPADVKRIRELLEMTEKMNREHIHFHLARKEHLIEDESENILDKARVIMEECVASMVFFTESHKKESGTDHNTNIAFELGYLLALEKSFRPRVYCHESVKMDAFSLYSGWEVTPYGDPNELQEHFEAFAKEILGEEIE